MADALSLERLLRRDHAVTLAGLSALCALAWLYLATGAGMARVTAMAMPGMPGMGAMPGMPGMPGMGAAAAAPGAMGWGVASWALVIAMWWIMMIAMMTPSATPAILLYARVHRQALREPQQARIAPTWAFASGYLLGWLGFALAAATLQWELQRAGLVSAARMGSQSRWLSAVILGAAGIYQLSPLKSVCLTHCRAPAAFLARHWRAHASGAVRLGLLHAGYCIACCWVLMALLFVGGVMNLLWIVGLTLLVLMEKTLPGGRWLGRAAGILLLAWGLATLRV